MNIPPRILDPEYQAKLRAESEKRVIKDYLNSERLTEHDMAIIAALPDDRRADLGKQRDALALRRRARSCGVPDRLEAACFGKGTKTQAMVEAERFVDEDHDAGRCLVLAGPTGVGKSWAAAAAALAVYQSCPTRTYINDQFVSLRPRFRYFPAICGALLDSERRSEAMSEATGLGLVVFDDFGVEYAKEGGLIETFLDEIIWTRESYSRPTIITTNLDVEGLRARLSARIVDRLRGEWGRVVSCNGESLRRSE